MFKTFLQRWVKPFSSTPTAEQSMLSSNTLEDKNRVAFTLQRLRVVIIGLIVIVFLVSVVFLTKAKPKEFTQARGAVTPPAFTSPIKATLKEHTVLQLQQSMSNETDARETLETELATLKRRLNDTEATLNASQAWLLEFQRTMAVHQASVNTVVTSPSRPTTPVPSFHSVTTPLMALQSLSITDDVVPAGSYVTAVLLSGVDVSAGVNAMSDPKPVLLRTVQPIRLPNGKTIDLTNCRIVGASFGEVSSERAYIRLERFSCFVHDAWVDVPVFGYVAGSDGKAGIRGKVVMRDQAMLSRAFLGGLISGLGDTLSKQLTTPRIDPFGSTETVTTKESLAYGTGSGINSATTHMADYYIKRAEQYQPVIQVMAGTIVDVVFHQGFSLQPEKDDDAKNIPKDENAPLAAMFDWGVDTATPTIPTPPHEDSQGGIQDE
jgi:hypothetical protein